MGNKAILDRTAFYPEGGGQEADHGTLKKSRGTFRVYDAQKVGGIVVHYMEKTGLKTGDKVRGEIDWERREQLSRHHTAIHLINAAARKALGRHIWQAGSGKGADKAHLDITHYLPITDDERVRIEKLANGMVRKAASVKAAWTPRAEAEKKHGLRLYQGGAVPGKKIRVLEIRGIDVEACGGLHCRNTSEVGRIIITGTERIQDGIDRITIKAGKAAEAHIEKNMKRVGDIVVFVRKNMRFIKLSEGFVRQLDERKTLGQLKRIASVFSVPVKDIENTARRFCTDIIKNTEELNMLRKRMGRPKKELGDYLKSTEAKDLEEAFTAVFSVWKRQGKERDRLRSELAKTEAKKILQLHKVKKDQLFEVIGLDRKELIAVAEELLLLRPRITVILANQVGDVVGMTKNKSKDMGKIIRELCSSSGGSGGGTKGFAQGKAELSKLLKVAGKR